MVTQSEALLDRPLASRFHGLISASPAPLPRAKFWLKVMNELKISGVADKRRADVVGIFPNAGLIIRLIGAVLLQGQDGRQLQHRYLQIGGRGNSIALASAAEACRWRYKVARETFQQRATRARP